MNSNRLVAKLVHLGLRSIFASISRSKCGYIPLYSHVSVGSQQIGHVSGVGELPSIDVLYDDDGLVRCTGWFHDISCGVFYPNLLTQSPILQPIADITRTGPGFVRHLLTVSWNRTAYNHMRKYDDSAFYM